MTEGERSDERPSASLAAFVLERFGVTIDGSLGAVRGEESIGWRGTSPGGDRFVQRFPVWRSVEALTWCDAVARAAATQAPACVHALAAHDGSMVASTAEGPVMVFQFVEGQHPQDDGYRTSAAELLADLHRGIVSAWNPSLGPRPGAPRREHHRDDLMVDADLDRWEREIATRVADMPIHGDFYGGNLLVDDNRIVGVVDWSDADLIPMEQEVAWSTWEFCQDEVGEDLIGDAAESFLDAYRSAGGPAPIAPPFDPFPWIRRRLRLEARGWFYDPRSAFETDAYHEAQLVAFERLRDRRLPGR
jgi:Ser/Thr protein kinase RdoA (MazF antagonist)